LIEREREICNSIRKEQKAKKSRVSDVSRIVDPLE
jgi:hypothetical protein